MKNNRIFLFDFVRAIATIFIVITHYNALFVYNVYRPEIAFGRIWIGNVYIGTIGVSMFLIISGALLYKSYGTKEKTDWKSFYSKRFWTIYPCFWLAYFLIFFLTFYECRGAYPGLPIWRIIYSILGVDGYLLNYGVPTIYLVGEWFLGFILIVYAIFPLLKYLINKVPVLFGISVLALFGASLLLWEDRSWYGISIPVRLVDFVIGMYFMKYVKPEKLKWWLALPALGVIVLNDLFPPSFISGNIQGLYIGFSFFLLFASLSETAGKADWIRNLCAIVCKYSYPCFIIHHWITYRIALKFDLNSITNFQSILLFITCCIGICFASYWLYWLNEKILPFFQKKKT